MAWSSAVVLLALSQITLASSFWPWGNVETYEQGYKEDHCPRIPIRTQPGHGTCDGPLNWFPWKEDSYEPWTKRPMCVQAQITDPDAPGIAETYCLFVKEDFAEKGIAFFTSRRSADIITGTQAFQRNVTMKGVNDLISGPFSPPPYIPHLFPDKGIGLIANRTLYRGERIMQETPTLIYDRGMFGSVIEEDRIPMHWHMVYQLPAEARDELLALHAAHGGDRVDDIMRTNAFGAYFSANDMHNNVLPRISRFNHDCRPNAHYYFDPNSMTQYVHAMKEIAPGEEILINYTDGEYSWEERQAATMVSWGFACKCSVCRQPADHVAASDKRLKLIKTLKEQLNDWTEPQPERPKIAEMLIGLYEQERLHAPIATAYEAAAYAYSVIGDEYKARQYAGKAVETLTILYGSDHQLTMDMESMMMEPKKHRTWKYSLEEDDLAGLEEDIPAENNKGPKMRRF